MAGQLLKPPASALIPLAVRAAQIRNIDSSWFGPMQPLKPTAPPGTQPRQFEIQPGQNLIYQPRNTEVIQFSDLIYMADNCDLVRIVIESLKDQLCLLPWQVRYKADPGETEKKRQERSIGDPKVTYWQNFFQWPNPQQSWTDFLRMLLEDLFVLDAPSILIQRNRGKKIGALRVIDGQTITRLIDDQGFTPLTPSPAYQQIMYGMPALDLTEDDLVYRPRVQRARKIYGFSPVEQVLMTLNIAVRRQRFQLNAYTEGNIPEALYTMPGNLTDDQVRKFQKWFDLELSGNLAARRRIWFIPGDDKGVNRIHWTKDQLIKDEADEWFARVICFAFRISPKELIHAMNRATAVESQDSAEEMGVASVAQWIVDTMNYIIQRKAGDANIEFAFAQKREADVLKQAQADQIYVNGGIRTRNEVRERIGDDPSSDPMANVLGITTGTGFVPLDQIETTNALAQQAANKPEPNQNGPNNSGGNGSGSGGNGKTPTATKPSSGASAQNNQQKVWKSLSKAQGAATAFHINTHEEALHARAVSNVESAVKSFFHTARHQLASAIQGGLGKAEGDGTLDDILRKVDELAWDDLVDPVEKGLADAGNTGASIGVAQIKVHNVALISESSDMAHSFAHKRAAELVGKKWDENGQLRDNPNAKWAISETTRDDLRRSVRDAFAQFAPISELVEKVKESWAFSDGRAKMIARTEVARAQSLGTMDVWKSSGIVKSTYWVTSADGPCDECADNRDAGAVDLGKAFPSGDTAPPSHPNCRCALVAAEIAEN